MPRLTLGQSGSDVPSGQVPVWVPIAVGLIGLAGVLGAQVIAAWREDKRWQREKYREDLRWQRDRDKDQQQREHDIALQLNTQQLACYSQFALSVTGWNADLVRAAEALRSTGAVQVELSSRLRERAETTEASLATMEILGSDTARQAGRDVVDALGRLHLAVSASATVPTADELADRIEEAFQGCEHFRQQIRHDLKVRQAR